MFNTWYSLVLPIPDGGYQGVKSVTIYFYNIFEEEQSNFYVRHMELQGCWNPGWLMKYTLTMYHTLPFFSFSRSALAAK